MEHTHTYTHTPCNIIQDSNNNIDNITLLYKHDKQRELSTNLIVPGWFCLPACLPASAMDGPRRWLTDDLLVDCRLFVASWGMQCACPHTLLIPAPHSCVFFTDFLFAEKKLTGMGLAK